MVPRLAFLLPLLAAAALSPRQASQAEVVYERFNIESSIVARYATTRITSVVLNSASSSQELSFRMQLPETAFISSFSMIVNGTTFLGMAEEKQRALEEFEQRQQAGENVGLVASRGTSLFQIRINTAASSRTTFVLEYEELLVRRRSVYQQVINLNPGSVVEDFSSNVRVVDEQEIALFSASDFVTASRVSPNEVVYRYAPDSSQQTDGDFGLARDMMIEFDVRHPPDGAGLVIVNDCYFAQFFSPSGVPAIPVEIVFVIDVSGSMGGTKIAQARESLEAVINQLRPADRFSIVTFETQVSVWMDRLVSVVEYRQSGIQFARELSAGGGTNFAGGMEGGINILRTYGSTELIQLLVILTDGQPTVGITGVGEILELASELLQGTRISLNTLGFGNSLDFNLLVRLALSNNGIAQRIYEGADAAEQLEGFYEAISSPILRSIIVSYPQNAIDTVSNLEFPLLFNGSEIVVAGKFEDAICNSNSEPVPVTVRGTGVSSAITFQSTINPGMTTTIAGQRPSTERLVAYLNIRQILDEVRITDDESLASAMREEALNLALQYNFVTELTSLIVVQENPPPGETGNFTLGGNGGGAEGRNELDAGGPVPGPIPPSGNGNFIPAAESGGAPPVLCLDVLLLVAGTLLHVLCHSVVM